MYANTCEDITAPEESRGDIFLGPYVWPHLRTLRLSGIGCSSASARVFLGNHPGIETLDISRHFGLDMDEYEENYTEWDSTPYPLPNLRWLTVEETEQATHILSSPTTLPRPRTRLSGISASEGFMEYLRDLPHIYRLDFRQCNRINLADLISNTAFSARLQWLDVDKVYRAYRDDWFAGIVSLLRRRRDRRITI